MDSDTVTVERVIKAPADRIFALLADAGKHASFDGSESVNHASEQSVPLSMGSKFGMAMRGRETADHPRFGSPGDRRRHARHPGANREALRGSGILRRLASSSRPSQPTPGAIHEPVRAGRSSRRAGSASG